MVGKVIDMVSLGRVIDRKGVTGKANEIENEGAIHTMEVTEECLQEVVGA